MAETPKLTAKELAKLIANEKNLSNQLALIDEFCKAFDREQGREQPVIQPDRPEDRPATRKDSI